jgi:hypothetical protein
MNIPEDLKTQYELHKKWLGPLCGRRPSSRGSVEAILRSDAVQMIERIARAEQALADKYRLGFEDCRAQAMHVVDEHDGYLERIGNLEPTLTNPAFKLESE